MQNIANVKDFSVESPKPGSPVRLRTRREASTLIDQLQEKEESPQKAKSPKLTSCGLPRKTSMNGGNGDDNRAKSVP